MTVDDSESIGWLIESLLRASFNKSASLHSLMQRPILFPFSFTGSISLSSYTGLELMRFGLDEEMVMLVK